MNRRPTPQRTSHLPRPWDRAVQSLEDALYRNTEHPNAEKIRQLYKLMFGELDEFEDSGKLKLPEWNECHGSTADGR